MRSGPATRTALFWQECSVRLLRAGRGQRILRRIPKNAAQSRAGQRICKEPKLFTFPTAASRWPAASSSVCGGLSEEAATPGQPSHILVRKRTRCVSGEPSRRFTLENHKDPPALPSCRAAQHRTSRVSGSTLLESHFCFKHNSAHLCEQPVNAVNFLWKALEKPEEIPNQSFAP